MFWEISYQILSNQHAWTWTLEAANRFHVYCTKICKIASPFCRKITDSLKCFADYKFSTSQCKIQTLTHFLRNLLVLWHTYCIAHTASVRRLIRKIIMRWQFTSWFHLSARLVAKMSCFITWESLDAQIPEQNFALWGILYTFVYKLLLVEFLSINVTPKTKHLCL